MLRAVRLPPQGLERNEKIDRWRINCHMRPIGSGQQDVGHLGVAAGRGWRF